ncbi:MAG: hypothetical protein U0L47_08575 [Paludibacteraceae bacterium]|nr:hypothetical protein [Paludibacteraceae bacterium]
MERYSLIHSVLPREFVLLQGTGCRWKQCTFCDYHGDVSDDPFAVNREVLAQVQGVYGVLDVINSGSAMELDKQTLEMIKQVVKEKNIHTLWFEAHYMYKNQLAKFAEQFDGVEVKFRCGVESFDGKLREQWKKGIAASVTAEDVAKCFQGVCLLCCTNGDSQERILRDISLAEQYFEYASVNVFCENTTAIKRDEELVKWFVDEVYHMLKQSKKIEILINNTDLGVG